MLKHWTRGMTAAGLGLTVLVGTAAAQAPNPNNAAGVPPQQPAAGGAGRHQAGDLPGPIDNLQDLQDTGKMLFKLADTNNDGLISQKEAIDAGNLLVGGFFFRADANGDGTLSQEEARQARDNLLRQKPLLRVVFQRAAAARANDAQGGAGGSNPNPINTLASMLDGNHDRQLQATELRKAVQTGVQSLYETADTNRDGQLSPSEVNAAMVGMARTASQAAFQAADTDKNGQISQAEFDKAIEGPAHAVFQMMDTNGDGQISPQEAQAARRVIMSQVRMLQVPEPANSPRNLIRTGERPDQAAPVPNFGGAAPNAAPNQPR